MNLDERFEAVTSEYSEFKKIENKRSKRRDLHAFILLDELFPKENDLISCAMHDKCFLDYSFEELDTLSDEHIFELTRCGILYDSEEECLFIFT